MIGVPHPNNIAAYLITDSHDPEVLVVFYDLLKKRFNVDDKFEELHEDVRSPHIQATRITAKAIRVPCDPETGIPFESSITSIESETTPSEDLSVSLDSLNITS